MTQKLLKSTSRVSSMTLLSRVLGFLRDVVFAHVFGASSGFDSFILAFKLPNFMRALFAEGAFSQAFVPVLARYQHQQSPTEVRRFLGRMQSALWLAVVLLTLLVCSAAPQVVRVFAPGFVHDPLRFALASDLLRVTFPYLILITTAAFYASILNTYKTFMLPAFVPCLLNVALIAAAYVGTHFISPSVTALAWGVIVGGVCQALAMVPALHKRGLLPRPSWFWRDAGVRRVVKLMLPAVFGVSVAQISILISTVFASYLVVGSLSWLYYSERIVYLPVGVFGVAIATVVLPTLSQWVARDNTRQYAKALAWGVRLVWLLAMPAAAGIAVLAGPLLVSLFHYGAFSLQDVFWSRQSLLAYCVGLPAFMLVKVMAAAFYAHQDIKTPVKVAMVAVLLNVVLNALLIGPMLHAGLALATSLSSWFNALMLIVLAYRRRWIEADWAFFTWCLRSVLAACACALVVGWLSPAVSVWQAWSAPYRLLAVVSIICLGAAVYLICLWGLGWRWRHMMQYDQTT